MNKLGKQKNDNWNEGWIMSLINAIGKRQNNKFIHSISEIETEFDRLVNSNQDVEYKSENRSDILGSVESYKRVKIDTEEITSKTNEYKEGNTIEKVKEPTGFTEKKAVFNGK